MWLDRILEAKKEKNITTKSMAEYVKMPEKTIARILSGKTPNPYVTTVIALGAAVGLSPREVFSETGVVVGDQDLAILQAEVDRLKEEILEHTTNEESLKTQVSSLTVERDLLVLQLDHKEEIVKYQDEIIALLKAKNE